MADEDWTMTETPAGVPYLEGMDPRGLPFGTSVAPELAEDPEKMRRLLATLERNFASYPAQAAQQPMGGGYQLPENFGQSIQGAFQSMPMREAERAVSAAIQFQGMRGYQQSLQAGEAAETALARWAPLMFYSHPSAVSSTMRAMRAPTITPYQQGMLDRGQAMLDLAKQRAAAPKYINVGGVAYRQEGDKLIPVTEPKPQTISPGTALNAITDPMRAAFVESSMGKEDLANLTSIARSGIRPAGTPNAPAAAVAPPAAPTPAAAAAAPPAQPIARFAKEEDARKAGKQAGDVVYLVGIGKVRLK